MSELNEIGRVFHGLQTLCETHLPKVDSTLIHDLLIREQENPKKTPFYMIEVFTKEKTDSEVAKNYIFEKTGMMPAVYDHGTHYVTNQKLTLEMLKEISDSEDVLEVTGEYTGSIGGWGASHEHRDHKHKHDYYYHPSRSQQQVEVQSEKNADIMRSKKNNDYRLLIYMLVGVIGAIALVGFIVSGGLLPNVNKNTAVQSSSSLTSVSGAIHGYVGGPAGLPAIGATVVAAEQRTGYTVNSIISLDGKYFFNLPSGKYNVMVAYPDGTHKTVNNFEVQSGSAHNLDFKY
jgi:Carboxypeptidase regulatory-like domain